MTTPTDHVNDGLHTAREPRQKDSARTRALILTAAQHTFGVHGYADAGLRDIARDAGVNVALVARYFGSKEKLFEAALDDMLTRASLWENPREGFGKIIVAQFTDPAAGAMNPLPVLMLASGDAGAQAVALSLVRTRVLAPLAAWLGDPCGEERAAEILALCAGFFAYRMMLPLESFSGGLSPEIRTWLEGSLQAIVDRSVAPPPPRRGGETGECVES